MAKVLVVADLKGAEVRKPTLELLTKARQEGLAADAAVVGSGVAGVADLLAGHGARKVYLADDAALANYSTHLYVGVLAEAAKQSQADQVWFTVSETSKALAPALAGRMDGGYINDAVALKIEGDTLEATRPVMAAKVLQKVRFKTDGLKVISIRGGAFDVEEAAPKSADVVKLSPPEPDPRVVTKEVIQEETGEVDLGEATTVVSVGRGVKGPEGVDLVKPLVSSLGAAYGASRAVVDSGWMPYNRQVGQTGRVVTPDVYFSIGISGAIQHLAGMSGSKLIIAVNKDPDAPIFSIADYGIVGDLFKVVPVLIEEVKKYKQ